MTRHTFSFNFNDTKHHFDLRHYSTYFPQNSFEILLKDQLMKNFLKIDDDVYTIEGIYDTIYSEQILETKSKSKYFDDINYKLYNIFMDLELRAEDSYVIHFKEDMLIVFVIIKIF